MTELAESLVLSRRRLLAYVDGLSRADLTYRPSPEDWSVIEVLAHLADVDQHWLCQVHAMTSSSDHCVLDFDQAAHGRPRLDPRQLPIAQVLAELARSHDAVVEGLAGMTEEQLAQTGKHESGPRCTVRDVFLRYPAHDREHERQIAHIITSRC